MNKKTPFEMKGTKLERTGETSFVSHLEDGSYVEGNIDPSKIQFAEDSRQSPGSSKFHVGRGKIPVRNVMSNKKRRELGLPEDPNLSE